LSSADSVLLSSCSKTKAGIIRKKIGNTLYRVSVHYSETSREHLEDKILRLVRNDLTDFAKNSLSYVKKSGIMESPQTGRLLEGDSLL
jgi:hypothetical protein